MNRTLRMWPALIVAGIVLSGSVVAQTPGGQLPPELLACAQETDVERRLECFDREMSKLSETPVPEVAEAASPEPQPTPEPEPEPAVAESPEPATEPEPLSEPEPAVAEVPEAPPVPPAAPEPAAPAPVATASAVTATAADSASATDDFGLSDQGPEAISAVVTDIAHRPYGEFVVLLDNGQIWEQKHRDNRFRIDVGETVTISEGLVSGYRLTAGDRNNSVQVERLK